MNLPLLRTIVILPGTVLVSIPSLILWLTREGPYAGVSAGPRTLQFWFAVVLGVCGFALAVRTMRFFTHVGE